MTTHPNACEERLDAHAFLWRPFHPSQFAAGDFVFPRKFFNLLYLNCLRSYFYHLIKWLDKLS